MCIFFDSTGNRQDHGTAVCCLHCSEYALRRTSRNMTYMCVVCVYMCLWICISACVRVRSRQSIRESKERERERMTFFLYILVCGCRKRDSRTRTDKGEEESVKAGPHTYAYTFIHVCVQKRHRVAHRESITTAGERTRGRSKRGRRKREERNNRVPTGRAKLCSSSTSNAPLAPSFSVLFTDMRTQWQ